MLHWLCDVTRKLFIRLNGALSVAYKLHNIIMLFYNNFSPAISLVISLRTFFVAHKKQSFSYASAPQTVKNLKMMHYKRTPFLARNPFCKPEIPPMIEASLKSN